MSHLSLAHKKVKHGVRYLHNHAKWSVREIARSLALTERRVWEYLDLPKKREHKAKHRSTR